jgi:hypothetical protein
MPLFLGIDARADSRGASNDGNLDKSIDGFSRRLLNFLILFQQVKFIMGFFKAV